MAITNQNLIPSEPVNEWRPEPKGGHHMEQHHGGNVHHGGGFQGASNLLPFLLLTPFLYGGGNYSPFPYPYNSYLYPPQPYPYQNSSPYSYPTPYQPY